MESKGVCITSHHKAGMQYAPPHHTTLCTACALHSAILSGYNDTSMQNNATRLTFRTLRLVPISSPLYTPVAQSTFGPEMRLKQPETQQKMSEKCADTLRKMRRFRFWLQLHFPAVPGCFVGKQHQGRCSIPNSVWAQECTHLFIGFNKCLSL